MRFALVEGESREAVPGLPGACRACGDPMIAKCGQHRVWHWAHRGTRTCDTWWESETQWHRDWKDNFPKDWQESIHRAPNGERHIADVKTAGGVTLEFQHSFLLVAERKTRENFYSKLIWVVDGRRRARDRAQFFSALSNLLLQTPPIISARMDGSALLRDWKGSRVPVYFDFGLSATEDPIRFEEPTLWRLNPTEPSGGAYLSPIPKSHLIERQRNGITFEEPFTQELINFAERYRRHQQSQHHASTRFDWHVVGKRRARRRL